MNDTELANEMMAIRPTLVRFALKLCRDEDRSEDLASDAIAKAWRYRDRFEPGTSMRAWLFVILRNLFLSERRRARFDAGYLEDMPGVLARLSQRASQEDYVILKDVEKALRMIPQTMVDALMAVVFEGGYDEAAEAQGCPVGTIKSRVTRGRDNLNELLA